MKRKHGNKFYYCSSINCGYRAKTLDRLKRHGLMHNDKEAFKCTYPNCNFRALSQSGLKIHVANHMQKPAIICDFPNCGYQAYTQSCLVRHSTTHGQVRQFPCKFQGCKFRSHRRDVLKVHEERHNKRAQLPCAIHECTYIGRNKCLLKGHLRCHQLYPSFSACAQPGCNYFAKDSKSLKQHQHVHDSAGRQYACPLCAKYFDSKETLYRHSFTHTKEKPFSCPYCDYGTYLKVSLRQHCDNYHSGKKCNPDWPEEATRTYKYCQFSGTAQPVLKHKISCQRQLFVNLERCEINFL